VNAIAASSYSNTASAMTPGIPPNAPTNLSASPISSSRIDLSWTDNANNEDNFILERSTSSSFSTITSITLAPNTTSYSNTGLNTNITYYYRVKATNSSGSSGYSNSAFATTLNAPPNAPSNLTASRSGAVKAQRIDLSWSDNSSNETNFLIDRATTNTFTANVVTYSVPANTVSFSDTAIARSTTYYYRIRAINSVGSSVPSNVASASTR
jgi:titin